MYRCGNSNYYKQQKASLSHISAPPQCNSWGLCSGKNALRIESWVGVWLSKLLFGKPYETF